MKLKNKKTGEIGKILKQLSEDNQIEVITDNKLYVVKSLAELNKEWEDYEEPKKYYWIDYDGKVKSFIDLYGWQDKMKENGNYFETEEEAEKAVEKLKAITRLNKCGFRFEGYTDRDRANGGDIIIYAHIDIPNNNLLEEAQPAMLKDLDLLFGGEE